MFYCNCFLSNAAGESSVADPEPGSVLFWPLDPGSGIEKNPDPGYGIRDEHPGSYFWVKNTSILWCGSGTGIRDLLNPGSGIRDGKYRIRDKLPGSATLGESDKHSMMYSRDNAQEVVSLRHSKITFITPHRKKRFTSFPSPAGMSQTKLPLGRNNSVMTSLFPPRESLVVTSRWGRETREPFFYGATATTNPLTRQRTVAWDFVGFKMTNSVPIYCKAVEWSKHVSG